LRSYFDRESVLEVDTPALSPAAVSDVHIESLSVSSSLVAAPLYLHTSPEFCMKRLLASGYPDIYSICRVFRDGEVGQRHQPEFTMVEWYRLGFSLDNIIDDTLGAIASALGDPTLADGAETKDYRELFTAICGADPLNATIQELADLTDADPDLRRALGERVADRFEVFMGSVELANGYVELTDALTQAERIASDQATRTRHGKPLRPHDRHLIAALAYGLPACAGVAMGLERLHMMHDKTDNIRDVIPFDFEVPDE
jgi:lysyl-tRNA synthetase class 2